MPTQHVAWQHHSAHRKLSHMLLSIFFGTLGHFSVHPLETDASLHPLTLATFSLRRYMSKCASRSSPVRRPWLVFLLLVYVAIWAGTFGRNKGNVHGKAQVRATRWNHGGVRKQVFRHFDIHNINQNLVVHSDGQARLLATVCLAAGGCGDILMPRGCFAFCKLLHLVSIAQLRVRGCGSPNFFAKSHNITNAVYHKG